MKKSFLLTVLLLLFGSVFCFGQGKVSISSPKLKLWDDPGDNRYFYSPRSHGSKNFTLSYRRENYLNSNYFANKQAGIIVPTNRSLSVSLSYFLLNNVEVEGAYFGSVYDFNASDIDATQVSHNGLEFFANLYVLPPLGEWTSVFCPYVGAGYQTSSLAGGKSSYSTSINSPIAKGGFKLYFMRAFLLKVEYKQTLPVDSEKLFRVVEVGLGMAL